MVLLSPVSENNEVKKYQIRLFYVTYVLWNSAEKRAGEYNGIKGFSLQKDLVLHFVDSITEKVMYICIYMSYIYHIYILKNGLKISILYHWGRKYKGFIFMTF